MLPPDHIAREDVEEVIRTAHRVAGLTRQLLTISRRQPMTVRQISLVGLFRRMEMLLSRLLPEGALPGMRGNELVQRLLVHWPALPVLFISGSLLEENLLGREILIKPFNAEELEHRVAALME